MKPAWGPPQHLVPGEADQVGPVGQVLLHRGLSRHPFQRDPRTLVHRQNHPSGKTPGQLGHRRLGCEAPDPEIRGVHHQDHGGFPGDRVGVILQGGDVGGSHLHQTGPGEGEDLRDPEASADLDLLTPGNHDLPARRQSREHQQHRGGVVVDHQGRLGPGQGLQDVGNEAAAPSPFTGGKVQFDVGIAGVQVPDGIPDLPADGAAAHVGVQDHPRGVDHPADPAAGGPGADGIDPADHRRRVRGRLAPGEGGAQFLQHRRHVHRRQRPADYGKPAGYFLPLQQFPHLWNRRVRILHDTEVAGIEPAAVQLRPTVLKTAGTTRSHQLPDSFIIGRISFPCQCFRHPGPFYGPGLSLARAFPWPGPFHGPDIPVPAG